MDKDTREKLVEAATVLFAWKGFAGVSIRELAKAANVNSALISYYFGGKEGLYGAVLDMHLSHLLSVIEEASHSATDPEERISLFVKAISSMHKERPYLLRLVQGELINPTVCFEKVLVVFFKKIMTFLPATLAEGKEREKFAEDIDPIYGSIALVSMINFYYIIRPLAERILPQDINRDEDYIKQILYIYLNGVKEG